MGSGEKKYGVAYPTRRFVCVCSLRSLFEPETKSAKKVGEKSRKRKGQALMARCLWGGGGPGARKRGVGASRNGSHDRAVNRSAHTHDIKYSAESVTKQREDGDKRETRSQGRGWQTKEASVCPKARLQTSFRTTAYTHHNAHTGETRMALSLAAYRGQESCR